MKTSFSPGPWGISNPADDKWLQKVGPVIPKTRVSDADLALIAAAPDLYAALENLLVYLE